jgi:NADPH:quinone reductase-like Zn-dependent oxidoreductase
MNASWLGPIKQISYTTDNLDRLVAFWETQVRVGPWSIFRNLTLSMDYEGRAIAIPFDVALCMHHGSVLELIQIRGDGPSPFHDTLNRPIIGLQRLASLSQDIEADARSARDRGMEQYASGRDATGQRYYYFRSPQAPGVILELLEDVPSMGQFLGYLEARAAGYAKAMAAAPSTVPVSPPQTKSTSTMKAANLHAYGDPTSFRIDEVPEPPVGPGQLRVKVAGAGVNPADVKMRKGWLKDFMPLDLPARIGSDVAGVVEAVGAGVTAFKPGDRVMGMISPMGQGAYGEKVVFDAAAFVRVPEGFDLVNAAALPTGVLTGVQLVEKGIAPRAGDVGLVLGAAGSTGRAAVLAAVDAGAKVYAVVRAAARGAIKDLPVAGVVDAEDAAALRALGPLDFLADTVGGETAERLFAYLKPEARVASIAFPPPNPPVGSTQRFSSLIVSFDGPRLERFTRDLIEKKRSMPVAHRIPLAEVVRAHELMDKGNVGGKIVLVP